LDLGPFFCSFFLPFVVGWALFNAVCQGSIINNALNPADRVGYTPFTLTPPFFLKSYQKYYFIKGKKGPTYYRELKPIQHGCLIPLHITSFV
jgi:hypothetical protein